MIRNFTRPLTGAQFIAQSILNPLRALTLSHWLIVFGSCVPILLIVFTIFDMGYRLPHFDDWYFTYDTATQAVDGRLDVAQLFTFHNDHPILFTQLSVAFFAVVTGWDLTAMLAFTIVLAVGSALLILRLVALDFGARLAWFVAIPVFALLFPLRARVDWIIAFQNCFQFVLFFFLLGAWVLRSRPPGGWPLLAAVGCAFGATFSLASGIIVWALLLLVLIGRGYRKPLYYIFWLAMTALAILIYAQNFRSGARATVFEVLAHLDLYIEFVLLSIASPLAVYIFSGIQFEGTRIGLMLTGALGVVWFAGNFAAVLLHWRREGVWVARGSLWLAVAGYGLGNVLVTSYGRYTAYRDYPADVLNERVALISILFWIVAVILFAYNMQRGSDRRAQPNAVSVVNALGMAGFSGLFIAASFMSSHYPVMTRSAYEDCLNLWVYFRVRYNCQQQIILPPDDILHPRLDDLADRGLTLYREPTLNISFALYTAPDVIGTPPIPFNFQAYTLSRGNMVIALFEHAPQTLHYHLRLPTSHPRASFQAQVLIEQEVFNQAAAQSIPTEAVDGVRYVARALDRETGAVLAEQTLIFDPHIDTERQPFTLDLSAQIGSEFTLELTTEARDHDVLDWALWIDPHLHFER